MADIAKALDGGSVKGDAAPECPGQFGSHNGNILQGAQQIHESQTNELYVVFADKGQNLLFGVHADSSLQQPLLLPV